MTAPRPIPILVLCGQSNANNAEIIRAAFDKAAAMGGMLVQLAVNGSPLSSLLDHGGGDWQAGTGADQGELLKALSSQLQAILDPASPSHVPGAVLSSVIWLHGGADIYAQAAAASYGANLAALDRSLTQQFGAHDLVVAGMAEASLQHRDLTAGQAHNWQLVHDAQLHLAATSPRIHYVDPDEVAAAGGFSASQMFRWDYVHYSARYGFAQAFGRALADEALPGRLPLRLDGRGGYVAGDAGANSFDWSATGFGQVLGAGGYDDLTVTTARSLRVVAAGLHDFRILTGQVSQAILDAISVEKLRLGSGNDRVLMGGDLHYLHSGGGDDRATGSSGTDVILLGAGQDAAQGGAGRDRLWGQTGNDTLSGGAGADTLHGNAGSNLLTGGEGADQFFFEPGPGRDTVTDFTDHTDRLVLQGAQWSDLAIHAQGHDTLIDFGSRHILLQHVAASSLSAADFIFV